jgi:hypothetical protein
VFVIYDEPASFYNNGVWVEALRLMFERASASGLAKPDEISARVTQYCHSRHGMRYDTKEGAAQFGVDEHGKGFFQLMKYIEKVRNVVNCYDQAAAVQSFCGCLGVRVGWMYLKLFGYIMTIDLVGVGKCNNPLYEQVNKSKPVVAPDEPARTQFGNHAFNYVNYVGIGYIRDACAGPCVGTDFLRAYLKNTIDFDRLLREENYKITDGGRDIFINDRVKVVVINQEGITEIE